MRVEPRLERALHPLEHLRAAGELEQAIELRAAMNERTERAAVRRRRCEGVEQLAQSFDLGVAEAVGGKALPERPPRLAREEAVEDIIEPRAITGALDDHGGDRVTNGIARLEAHGTHRAHGIDGLRRRDREACPTEHPEELVGDTQGCPHVRHRERELTAVAARKASGGGSGVGAGPASASSVFSVASRRASPLGSYPMKTSRTMPFLSTMIIVGSAVTP